MRKNRPNLYQIFDDINQIEAVKDRKKALKEAESFELKGILQAVFDDRVQFDLPSGAPPVKEEDLHFTQFKNVIRLLPRLTMSSTIPSDRKEMMFFNKILMTQPTDMRNLIVAVKDGEFEKLFPNIDARTVKAVYPDVVYKIKTKA